MTTHITTTPEETKRVAAEFARTLHGGEIVFLEGELGAGKTTFVKGLVEALGIVEEARSPTFAVMNLYEVSETGGQMGQKIRSVAHLDCYRLKRPEELLELGLEDLLDRPDTILVVEWPPAELTPPADRVRRVKFGVVDGQTRQIDIA